MNCRAADIWIQRSLDVPLSPAERARLDTHLEACPACRHAWDEYRRLSQAATAWARRPGPAEMPPDQFTAQVLSRIAAVPASRPRPVRPLLPAAGAALAAVLALSPLASPWLPGLTGWHFAWPPPMEASLLPWLRALPQDVAGLWAGAVDGLVSVRWAAWLVLLAVPGNAVLCLRAWRGAREAA